MQTVRETELPNIRIANRTVQQLLTADSQHLIRSCDPKGSIIVFRESEYLLLQ